MGSCLHCWYPDAITHAWVFLWPRNSGSTFPISWGWQPVRFSPQLSALSSFSSVTLLSQVWLMRHSYPLSHHSRNSLFCGLRANNRQSFLTPESSSHMRSASPIKVALGCNTVFVRKGLPFPMWILCGFLASCLVRLQGFCACDTSWLGLLSLLIEFAGILSSLLMKLRRPPSPPPCFECLWGAGAGLVSLMYHHRSSCSSRSSFPFLPFVCLCVVYGNACAGMCIQRPEQGLECFPLLLPTLR